METGILVEGVRGSPRKGPNLRPCERAGGMWTRGEKNPKVRDWKLVKPETNFSFLIVKRPL